jgi:hypothetical protein
MLRKDPRAAMEQGGRLDIRSVIGYSHDVPEYRRQLVAEMDEAAGLAQPRSGLAAAKTSKRHVQLVVERIWSTSAHGDEDPTIDHDVAGRRKLDERKVMDEFISPIWETVFAVATPIVVAAAMLWSWLGSKIIVSSERRRVNKSRRSASVGQFAVKTMIVAAAVVVSTWIMLDVLDAFADRRMQQLEQMLRATTSLGGRQFWTNIENQLDALADPKSDLPPDRRQKILANVKVVSDRWRPFMREAASAIDSPAPHEQRH